MVHFISHCSGRRWDISSWLRLHTGCVRYWFVKKFRCSWAGIILYEEIVINLKAAASFPFFTLFSVYFLACSLIALTIKMSSVYSDTSSSGSERLGLDFGMEVISVVHLHLVLSEDLSGVSQSVLGQVWEVWTLVSLCRPSLFRKSESMTQTQAKFGAAPDFAIYHSAINFLRSVLLLRERMV